MEALSQILEASPAFLSPKEKGDAFGSSGRKSPDVLVQASSRVASGLKDIERSRNMLHLHIGDILLAPLETTLKEGIPKIREIKKKFDKASDEHDTHNDYLRQREEFRDQSLEFAQELKKFQMATQIEMSENTLSFMYAFQTFYHQGYEILKDSDPALKELTGA
ncbi:hypothetical protein DSO57_1030135 [Entomophthora muscae]|uniref:Uncharacterized protein n=1 Tax=Entomophthora muscae TaxID=34485 RepID=A0ACC2S2U6_9FUNG|nr:hypothetical protein DSO57_1030135 [Entomophthora muscae]